MLQFIRDWFYITEARAIACGCSHEGWLYGIPCWLGNVEEPDMIGAVPKSRCLEPLLKAIDMVFDLAAMVLPFDKELSTPLTIGKSLLHE